MENFTLDIITKHLGQPVRRKGNEYEWQCPICKDTGMDNLKFNEQKGILYCFADESHSRQILSDIMRNRTGLTKGNAPYEGGHYSAEVSDFKKRNQTARNHNESHTKYKKQPLKSIVQPVKMLSKEREYEFFEYMLKCNDELLQDKKSLTYLMKQRGLRKETVAFCGLGIDKVKRQWVIPTFAYSVSDCFITGFEYRPPDLSKNGLKREKDTPTELAQINGYTPKTKILVLVEGYFDAYALYQYLAEIGQADNYHIVTPSNGVHGLLKQLSVVDFQKYKRFELYIDNDETSRPIAEKILYQYPQFHNVRLDCTCKDFNEHYLKCIKQTAGGTHD